MSNALIWTGAELSERVARDFGGKVPPATHHVVYRRTVAPDGDVTAGYLVNRERLGEDAFEFFLARKQLGGPQRLGIAVLAIDERLDAKGRLVEGSFEQRRGSILGPLWGNPCRVEFDAGARNVRAFKIENGELVERWPSNAEMVKERQPRDPTEAEVRAVYSYFGTEVKIIDARDATMLEAQAGLTGVLHIRDAEGEIRGAGVGVHGKIPFVVDTDFRRMGHEPDLSAEDRISLSQTTQALKLDAFEARFDERGEAVVCRDIGGFTLLRRGKDGHWTPEPHAPLKMSNLTDDQRAHINYLKKYESRAILDIHRDGTEENSVVAITGLPNGLVTRHSIDDLGVEQWRKPADHTAAAAMHRESVFPSARIAREQREVRGIVDPVIAPVQPATPSAPAADGVKPKLTVVGGTSAQKPGGGGPILG